MPEREWSRWMQGLGISVRNARTLAGVTQADLSDRAGVSQAAISRLESARGMSTPLVVVLRILAALRPSVALLPPDRVPEDVRRLLDLSSVEGRGEPSSPDPKVGLLLDLYRSMTPVERVRFVQVAEVLAEAITSAHRAEHPQVPARREHIAR
jgi:transcriptional regulator with XRE-family HTH domain